MEPVRVAWTGDRVRWGDTLSITMFCIKIFKYAYLRNRGGWSF